MVNCDDPAWLEMTRYKIAAARRARGEVGGVVCWQLHLDAGTLRVGVCTWLRPRLLWPVAVPAAPNRRRHAKGFIKGVHACMARQRYGALWGVERVLLALLAAGCGPLAMARRSGKKCDYIISRGPAEKGVSQIKKMRLALDPSVCLAILAFCRLPPVSGS